MDPLENDRRFGRMLIERKLASEEQVAQALAELARLAASDQRPTLAALLEREGAITAEQLAHTLDTLSTIDAAEAEATRLRVGHAEAATVVRRSAPSTAAAAPPSPPPGGTSLGRYVLQSLLGAGGMGMVWRAWDTELDRAIALKQIRTEAVEGAEALARFHREARLAGKLRHPNIVAVHDVGEAEGRHFLTMDLVEGSTLQAVLKERRGAKQAGDPAGLVELRREVGILAEVAEAVAYAHTQGVIHRDLKPSNILLDAAGRAYVMDFGLAREWAADEGAGRERLTAAGDVLGTPAYMSPEQAAGDAPRVGPRADVWALGAILYEALTGRTPFESAGTPWDVLRATIESEPARPTTLQPQAPTELEAVCLRALQKDPVHRCPSAAAFAADLRRWLRGEPVEASAPSRRERLWRSVARHRGRSLAATGAVLLLVGILAAGREMKSLRDERSRALIARVRNDVEEFENRVMTTDMTLVDRAALARQQLDLLDHALGAEAAPGPALAWRGRLLDLLDRRDQAAVEFDRGCAAAPEAAVVWVLRGMHWLALYRRSRGYPTTTQGTGGVELLPQHAETAQERTWRTEGLADLATAARCPDAGAAAIADEMRIGKALAAFSAGGAAGCEQTLHEIEGLDRPRAWELRGLALYHLGRYDAAADACSRALAAWPSDAAALDLRAFSRRAQGLSLRAAGRDPADALLGAIADLDEEIRCDPEGAASYHLRGITRFDLAQAKRAQHQDPAEHLSRAVEDLDAAIRLDSGNPFFFNSRALARVTQAFLASSTGHDSRPMLRQALADCDAALRLDAEYASAWNTRGIAHRCLGDAGGEPAQDPPTLYRMAVEDADEALRRRPNLVPALANRGLARLSLALALRGRGAQFRDVALAALRDFDEAQERAPDYGIPRAGRGKILRLLGETDAVAGGDPRPRYREAAATWDRVIQLDPESPDAYRDRGELRLVLGQWERAHGDDARASLRQAAADYRTLLVHPPDRALDRANLGLALLNLGEEEAKRGENATATFAECESELRKAIAGQEPLGWMNLGLLCFSRGRFAEAIDAFETGARAAPQHATWAQDRIRDARKRLEEFDRDAWARELNAADAAMHGHDYATARPHLEAGLRLFDETLQRLDAAEKAALLADPQVPDGMALAHYRFAQILALAVEGRVRPADPAREVPAEQAAASRDAAFRELRRTLDFGPQWGKRFAGNPALAPLHADPRWEELIRDVPK